MKRIRSNLKQENAYEQQIEKYRGDRPETEGEQAAEKTADHRCRDCDHSGRRDGRDPDPELPHVKEQRTGGRNKGV